MFKVATYGSNSGGQIVSNYNCSEHQHEEDAAEAVTISIQRLENNGYKYIKYSKDFNSHIMENEGDTRLVSYWEE